MDTEIPDTVFSVTTLVSHKYGAYASAKCSKPKDAGESAAEVGPGDVGTAVHERDNTVDVDDKGLCLVCKQDMETKHQAGDGLEERARQKFPQYVLDGVGKGHRTRLVSDGIEFCLTGRIDVARSHRMF